MSPAEKAGVLKGDLIVNAASSTVRDADELAAIVGISSGAIQLLIRRGDDIQTIMVNLESPDSGKPRLGVRCAGSQDISTVQFGAHARAGLDLQAHQMCERECNGKIGACDITDKACSQQLTQCLHDCEQYSGYRRIETSPTGK